MGNLTVSIKNLNDDDPSEQSPVFFRIGDRLVKIKDPLSVTWGNTGTNWVGNKEYTIGNEFYFYMSPVTLERIRSYVDKRAKYIAYGRSVMRMKRKLKL